MEKTKYAGGAKQRRGAIYQDYSLLFYILMRLVDYPELESVIESIEDATIIYTLKEGDSQKRVTEFVQCKKREAGDAGTLHAGFNDNDPWIPGQFSAGDLKDWIIPELEGHSVIKLLNENPNHFYTVLVFGTLQNKLQPFVPEGLKDYLPLRYPFSRIRQEFPVNYSHKEDPFSGLKNNQVTIAAKKRIRIVSTASPRELERECAVLLQDAAFRVSTHKLDIVLDKLQNLIIKLSATQGRVLGRELLEIILAGRMERGLWQVGESELKIDNQLEADPNKGDVPNWIDFELGRYADRPEFDIAWSTISDKGAFATVNGTVGTGKTTLCRYLMYKFLKANQNNRAYYLTAVPATDLTDEVEFLNGNIDTDTLFIVDDEHFAGKEVGALIEAFDRFKSSGNARARLVISSKINYGRAEGLAQGQMTNELRQAVHIPLPENSLEVVENHLSQLRRKASLSSSLSDKELAALSEGVIGLALLIARANQELRGAFTRETILTRRNLKTNLTDWMLNYLPEIKSRSDFDERVTPIFIISAIGLPVPEDYSELIAPLSAAGFLESFDIGDDAPVYRAANANLAFAFQKDFDFTLKTLGAYIESFPQWLPHTLARVVYWGEGKRLLEELCLQQPRIISKAVTDKVEGLTLGEATTILQAIRYASRDFSISLYKKWVLREDESEDNLNRWFFHDVVARARSAPQLTNFLKLIHDIDYSVGVLKILAEKQLNYEVDDIISLFLPESCRLDQVAACLRSIKRCSERMATQLYEKVKESDEFEAKISRTEADDGGHAILLRYCEELKAISRTEAYESLEKYLPPEKILNTILLKLDAFNPVALFLTRLQRLHPRWAAEIVSTLWNDHDARLKFLLRHEKDLDSLSEDLYALSKINRLIAVRVSFEILDRLFTLLGAEQKYGIIGSKIELLRKYITPKISEELCETMDKERVLRLVLSERRYLDVVGKFLYDLTQSSVATAAWFESRLDYQTLLRVTRAPRLRDHVLLVRGFLAAAAYKRVEPLRKQMLDDASLIDAFRKRWDEARTLTEIGFCLTALTSCPLKNFQIERLLNFNDSSDLRKDIKERIRRTANILHIANGLYGAARFDIKLAKEALRLYVDRINAEQQNTRESDGGFGRNKNLVELGCLFHVASSINPVDARRLINLLNPTALAQIAATEDRLGRLTIFISGIEQASRQFALTVVDEICSDERWQEQIRQNEEIESVVHYLRAILRANKRKAAEIASFILSYQRQDIYATLKNEANLLLISNWINILSNAKDDGIEEFDEISDDLTELLQQALKYDTRLWHILESTEALLRIGKIDAALEFAAAAVQEARQMASVRRLQNLIILINKAVYIESQIPGFAGDLMKHLDGDDVAAMVTSENQTILAAFTYYLFNHNPKLLSSHIRGDVLATRNETIEAALKEPDSVAKIISLILCQMEEESLIEVIKNVNYEQAQAWELGLIALLYKVIYGSQQLLQLLNLKSAECKDLLLKSMSGHTGNLEFALVLYIAQYTAVDEARINEWRSEALVRAESEISSATRWLLRQPAFAEGLAPLSYYVWSYLKETIVSSTYFPWEKDIEGGAKSIALGHSYLRDMGSLVTT